MSLPNRTSPPKIVVDYADHPSDPSTVLFSHSEEEQDDHVDSEVTPLLDNDGELNSRPKTRRRPSERWQEWSRKKRNIIVFLLTVMALVLVLGTYLFWTLLDRRGSTRSPHRQILVHAKHGVVATELDICSNIGVQILEEGGNAVDAAIASAICVGSINMFSAGVGGFPPILTILIIEAVS